MPTPIHCPAILALLRESGYLPQRCDAEGRTGECEHLLQCVEHWSGHMGAEYDGGVMLTRVDGKEDLTLEQEVSVKSAVNAWISKK